MRVGVDNAGDAKVHVVAAFDGAHDALEVLGIPDEGRAVARPQRDFDAGVTEVCVGLTAHGR